MKTAMLIITMQLVATMRIFIVYTGIHEFDAYFSFVNHTMIIVYTILTAAIATIFLAKNNKFTVLIEKYSKFVKK